jgi:sodium/potassium-transporting ATPase subunit alpha
MAKGAPDILLSRCSSLLLPDGSQAALTSAWREQLQQTQIQWAMEGKRVLMLANKRVAKSSFPWETNTAEFADQITAASADGLRLVGLVGIVDPPRDEIPAVMKTLRGAGIRVFMVTGDFRLTAQSIGRACGIITVPVEQVQDFTSLDRNFTKKEAQHEDHSDRDEEFQGAIVLEGSELMVLNDAQWDQLSRYQEIVFARTTPEQKLRIVKEFQKRDEVVAMTGDGVNDAPVSEASCGIGNGSDVK